MTAIMNDFLSHLIVFLILYIHRSAGTLLIPGVPEADA